METMEVRGRIQELPRKVIAARIRRARRDADVSLDHVAEKAGTSRQHLINLEKGRHRPRPEMLERIADALNTPLEDFLVEEVQEPGSFLDGEAA